MRRPNAPSPLPLRPMLPRAALAFLASVLFGCGESPVPTTEPEAEPASALAAATASALVAVSVGWDHSCGVTAAGLAYCWGNNQVGQLGTADKTKRLKPAAVSGALCGFARPEDPPGQQRGRRVGRAAAQPRAHRNIFLERHIHAFRDIQFAAQDFPRAHD